jgi:HSP20 family protein
MERKKIDRSKWFQLGLTGILVVTVAVLTAMVYGMHARLDTLSRQGQGAPSLATSSPAPTTPTTTADPKTTTDPKSSDSQEDDWFSKPFDPGNWNPFTEMQRMQAHFDRIFSDSFSRFGRSDRFQDLVRDPGFSPELDVQEEGDRFVIRLDLPGVEKGNINVHVDGTEVQISGKRDNVVTDKDKDGRVVRQERRTGRFSRTIDLPEAVNADKMTAKDENGVFTVILPKA